MEIRKIKLLEIEITYKAAYRILNVIFFKQHDYYQCLKLVYNFCQVKF